MNLSGNPTIVGQVEMKDSSTPLHELGAKVVMPDGRVFRYVKAGATALVPGKLQQAPAEATNHQNLTPSANVAIGATSFTVTLGATAATANQYAGGWAIITTSTGAGYQYMIDSHPAADASATLLITLAEKVQVAFVAASSKVDLVANPYNGVIVNPTTATSCALGAAVYPITATYYGWIQVGGTTALLNDSAGGITVGTNVCASNAVDGSIEAHTGTQAILGTAVTGIAASEYGAVKLIIE